VPPLPYAGLGNAVFLVARYILWESLERRPNVVSRCAFAGDAPKCDSFYCRCAGCIAGVLVAAPSLVLPISASVAEAEFEGNPEVARTGRVNLHVLRSGLEVSQCLRCRGGRDLVAGLLVEIHLRALGPTTGSAGWSPPPARYDRLARQQGSGVPGRHWTIISCCV
jgi:hypothetical protein